MRRGPQRSTGLEGIGTHYRRYAMGNVMALAAGLLSFPILTRTLSNYEFGVIGYLDAILLVLAAALKLGLGDALLRFYPHGQGEAAFRTYLASILLVPLLASLAMWLVLMLGLAVSVALGWVPQGVAALLALAAVPLTVFASYVQWLMGAQEKSGVNVITGTAARWLQTLCVVTLVLMLWPSATSVYLGRLLAAAVMAVWMGRWLWQQSAFSLKDADLKLTRSAIIYGIPLALNEISQILFGFVDRLVLKAVQGDMEVVGLYVIGSSLAMYVSMLVSSALGQAYTPVLNRLYISEGAQAVAQFKQRMLVPLTHAVVLLVTGLIVTGQDFFILVAGSDKQGSAPVFVMLSVTFLGATLFAMGGYGAILAKRTGLVLIANLVAVTVKIGMNFLLIPGSGVMGTVYATMIGQVVLAVGIYVTCPADLRVMPGRRVLLQSVALALASGTAAWALGQAMGAQPPVLRLAVCGSVLMVLYCAPVLVMFPGLRRWISGALPFRGQAL
ncbi:oligosaccharide flippase family protein [Lysobacter ciconiae]|uniref:Oligosaccharide flippase family protein n=1 Tax=Novilysobacter ciconiae TaxID=2781022 RepID=A0A7S6UEJ2_9GAMM|nr:oligosaccharide flippase family protein [Lysobacter ciconiae]QOW18801.1 oligosaccharide flippase family protein [Lysobacter ciconiae]